MRRLLLTAMAALALTGALATTSTASHTQRNVIYHSIAPGPGMTCGEAKLTIYRWVGNRLPLGTLCWRQVWPANKGTKFRISANGFQFMVTKFWHTRWLTQVIRRRAGQAH